MFHDGHRQAHTVTVLKGDSFPPCKKCGDRVRYQLWKGVTVLNVNHEIWAWASMLSVWGTDVYIRLLIHDLIPHGPWN